MSQKIWIGWMKFNAIVHLHSNHDLTRQFIDRVLFFSWVTSISGNCYHAYLSGRQYVVHMLMHEKEIKRNLSSYLSHNRAADTLMGWPHYLAMEDMDIQVPQE
ncbi:MAG: hypothetical protein ACN4GR_06080 [Arenicellales bacterium]